MHSSDSAKHGCVDNAVWRTSITSGWLTVRKPCQNCTCIFTKNCSYGSMKLSGSVTDSFFQRPKMSLLYRLSRNHSKKMEQKLQRKCRRILVVPQKWACSSAGRAPALQAGGRRFEPCHVHQLFL